VYAHHEPSIPIPPAATMFINSRTIHPASTHAPLSSNVDITRCVIVTNTMTKSKIIISRHMYIKKMSVGKTARHGLTFLANFFPRSRRKKLPFFARKSAPDEYP
jgi:hypothetical protein